MPRGFTLIELMVSLAIFAFMTAFLLARYGTFNQTTLLTNLAYDTAITIRSAQSYGLNVQGTGSGISSCGAEYSIGNTCFQYPYGVDFQTAKPDQFILFTDLNSNGEYDSTGDANTTAEIVSTYNMNKGYSIAGLCVGSSPTSCTSVNQLDITFKRPIPDAIINGCTSATCGVGSTWQDNQSYGQVTLTANNTIVHVTVYSTGEISVGN